MANTPKWNIRLRHEWLQSPLKKKRVKRSAKARLGMLDAESRKAEKAARKARSAENAAAAKEGEARPRRMTSRRARRGAPEAPARRSPPRPLAARGKNGAHELRPPPVRRQQEPLVLVAAPLPGALARRRSLRGRRRAARSARHPGADPRHLPERTRAVPARRRPRRVGLARDLRVPRRALPRGEALAGRHGPPRARPQHQLRDALRLRRPETRAAHEHRRPHAARPRAPRPPATSSASWRSGRSTARCTPIEARSSSATSPSPTRCTRPSSRAS